MRVDGHASWPLRRSSCHRPIPGLTPLHILSTLAVEAVQASSVTITFTVQDARERWRAKGADLTMMHTWWPTAGLMLALIVALGAGSPRGGVVQEIKRNLSHFLTTSHIDHANMIALWAVEIEKRTDGRVEITVFPGASLCKPSQPRSPSWPPPRWSWH
jgi:hypothetical protein